MSAKVVQMGGSRALPLVTLVDSARTISLMREEILRSKAFYSAIAGKAQVSSSTVSNIASGATRWPRLETTVRILGALGWEIVARRSE